MKRHEYKFDESIYQACWPNYKSQGFTSWDDEICCWGNS